MSVFVAGNDCAADLASAPGIREPPRRRLGAWSRTGATTFAVLLLAQRGWGQGWLALTLLSVAFAGGRIVFGHLPDRIGVTFILEFVFDDLPRINKKVPKLLSSAPKRLRN